MFCNNCGYKNNSDSVYCENCGHKLRTPVTSSNLNKDITSAGTEKRKRTKIYNNFNIIFVMITLVIIFFIFILLTNFNNTNNDTDLGDGIAGCSHKILVDSNFEFGVILESGSDGTSSVSVTDDDGKTIDVNYVSEFGTVYVIPPKEGYKENIIYHITLDNAKYINEDYQKYDNLCFEIKSSLEENMVENDGFYSGTYTHGDNFITLNDDGTFILSFKSNDEMLTYKGTYIIEQYVLTCNAKDEIGISGDNFGIFTFNITAENNLESLNQLGISVYGKEGTIYTREG